MDVWTAFFVLGTHVYHYDLAVTCSLLEQKVVVAAALPGRNATFYSSLSGAKMATDNVSEVMRAHLLR